jgi:mRNA interferase HigB
VKGVLRLIGINHLARFARKHADARGALAAWQAEVEDATWTTPSDLKRRYPKASFVGGDQVVFDIRSDRYRLHARVNFVSALVVVVRIGTHREYDEWSF